MSTINELPLENDVATDQKDTKEASVIVVTPQNFSEYFEKSETLMKEKDFESAVFILSQVLEFLSADANKNFSAEVNLAKYYMQYGKALLRLAQSTNDVMGDEFKAAQDKIAEMQENETDDDNEDEEMEENDAETDGKIVEEAPQIIEKTDEKETNIEAVKNGDQNEEGEGENEETIKNGDQNENEENEENEEIAFQTGVEITDDLINENALSQMVVSEDCECAWESLETARLFCEMAIEKEKSQDKEVQSLLKHAEMLIEIHSLLGEVQMENSNFVESIEEFKKAIEIYHKYGIDNVRELAYFHFNCVMSAEHGELREAFFFHLQETKNVVQNRLVQLLKRANVNLKQKEEKKKT